MLGSFHQLLNSVELKRRRAILKIPADDISEQGNALTGYSLLSLVEASLLAEFVLSMDFILVPAVDCSVWN